MIKYLFILINTVSLFFYSLFSGDNGITVTNNIPTSIPPGQEVKVEIKIAKGNMSGFAKMQLELPAGISAKEMDSKGANFSYSDGIVKWVWASLPPDAEIVVSLALVTAPDASGKQIITGKYSYVDNNAKQVVEMSPVEVTISKDAVVSTPTTTTTPATTTTAATTQTAEPTATTTIAETTPTTQPSGTAEPAGNITVQRTIEKGSVEGNYNVTLKINKGLTKGFARYSDDVPADIVAEKGKTEDASFSVADGKVKFVWVAVPEKEVLEISYTLSGVKKPVTLNGEYSYLEQNQSKKYNLPAETITPSTETVVSTATQTPVTTTTTETQPKTDEPIVKKEGSVNYMVQIGAFTSSKVTASRLSGKFNISENIKSEMQGGFSKFMVGDHKEYKEARDHREKIRTENRVASAFVVAYSGPKRITVQEALMISNQKWFK